MPGVGLVHPAVGDQPVQPGLVRGVHHDHDVEGSLEPGLHEQRDVLDHHGVVRDGREDLPRPLRHQRMDDAVESATRAVVVEDEVGESRTVERAVGHAQLLAELRQHRCYGGAPGREQRTRDGVGVDDDGAELAEAVGGHRLAGADAPGQADAEHRAASGPGAYGIRRP